MINQYFAHVPCPLQVAAPRTTGRSIPIFGPSSRESRLDTRDTQEAAPPLITELSDAGYEAEPRTQLLFPSSQPDSVEEPEEVEVIDLVAIEEEEEREEEEREEKGKTASHAKKQPASRHKPGRGRAPGKGAGEGRTSPG